MSLHNRFFGGHIRVDSREHSEMRAWSLPPAFQGLPFLVAALHQRCTEPILAPDQKTRPCVTHCYTRPFLVPPVGLEPTTR